MALEDIKKELEEKFNKPLDEFYKRRIIFWNDEDKEFIDEINDLVLDNAKVLILSNNNQFTTKKLLSNDDLDNNYLVYNPMDYNPEKDWFYDIKLYSGEPYRADMISRWMDEMHISNNTSLRSEIKKYKEFFKSSTNRKAIAAFEGNISSLSYLYMSMLSVVSKTKNRTPESIIKHTIIAGNDIENKVKDELLKYSIINRFYELARNTTGLSGEDNIDNLVINIVLSAMSRNLSPEVLSGLENRYSDVKSGFNYNMIFEWIHSGDRNSFSKIEEFVVEKLDLYNRFTRFEIKDLINCDVLSIIDEIIINKLINKIIIDSIDSKTILEIVEKRRISAWYDKYASYYDGIYEVGLMKKFNEDNRNTFHHTNAKDMWETYTSTYYVMDTYYEDFHIAFNKCLNNINPNIDDEFKRLVDYIENLYKNWYLDKLGNNWTNVSENELSNNGYIEGINRQVNFYDTYIKNSDSKVFVIISDALRFNVAKELAKQLEIDTTADIEIESQEAILPSITKFGMAALLPHKKIETVIKNGEVKVLVDDHTSEMSDRDAILKSYDINSVALKYTDILKSKRDERREKTKGKNVVYIYHDTIDAAGHNDESTVFEACKKSIEEIKNLVNIITSDLQGVNIIITSDHGFLYTNKELKEDDKVEKANFKDDIVEIGRRYVLTNTNASPDFLMPIKGIYNDSNMLGFFPRENIRIKSSGSLKFVHGGASLQEMVVPVIKYKYLRSNYKSYKTNKDKYDAKPATIALLSSNRKISNMIFNLSFYQKEAVKDNIVPCTYEIYLTDKDNNIISDKQKIIADKTSDATKDREFKCSFNLKSQKYDNTALYYLVIKDSEGIQIPVKEEIQIDIAMAIDEFNFFD